MPANKKVKSKKSVSTIKKSVKKIINKNSNKKSNLAKNSIKKVVSKNTKKSDILFCENKIKQYICKRNNKTRNIVII